ncbi:MAG TPA: undecaprenyl-diphosphate phosphatase [Candidatus Levybacteria bacterium]|nr:undecaprenyl-diphosphate phosphatase [Candidatus Levybacteria bacterium]
MDILNAVILGVIEGITEFLPISSTGHLILASRLLGITSTDFLKSFEIFIQSGAILAVILLYWKDIFTKFDLLKKVFIAFIPTAVIGLLFYKILKEYLLGNTTITLLSLFLGGIALIIVELSFKKRKIDERTVTQITYKNAILVGLIQSISIIPGVSRSAASIIGGMLLGMDRKTAVEFSFLLAIPTLLAATGLDLIKTNFSFSYEEWTYLVAGFLSSFIVAVLVIKWLVSYVKKYTFIPFGIYRIAIAIFLFGLFFLR